MTKKMTEGKEWKLILLFALPVMAGQLLQQLYNTVDGIVVGNYVSSDALAAVGSCSSLAFAFIAVAMGMANGASVVVAQLFGAKRMVEMRRTVSTTLIMLFVLGVVFTFAGLLGAQFIMDTALNITDPEINEQSVVYFRIYSAGLLFQFVYNAVAGILRSIGDSKATLYFLLVSTIMNTVLDLVFVAVFNWGVAGAAIATVIAQIACAVVSFIYMFKRYEQFRFKLSELVFDKEKFKLCVKMGIPTTIQQLVVSCGHLMLQRLVNSFGPVTMAAYTVGTRVDHYVSVPSMGFFTAMSAFAGQNTGAGKPERIKRGLARVLAMNVALVSVLCVFINVFAEPVCRLFGVEGEILQQAVEFLRFISIIYPVFAIYIPFNGTFQGCGVPHYAMTAAILALTGRVIGAYTMAYVLDAGYASCWEATIVGWAMALVFALVQFKRGKWQNRGVARLKGED